jgi:hypothetical protein
MAATSTPIGFLAFIRKAVPETLDVDGVPMGHGLHWCACVADDVAAVRP